MKITIETDGGDVKVSSSGMEGVPAEIAEKAARLGALNAGAAPAELNGLPDASGRSTAEAESSMDAGPAPTG